MRTGFRGSDRWLDGLVVALVVTLLGLAATAPRADRGASARLVSVVDAPSGACRNVAAAYRQSCLAVTYALAIKR